jgi:bacteriocin-like protein
VAAAAALAGTASRYAPFSALTALSSDLHLMEKIMSKTTIHNTEGRELTVDELTADELDQISGGSASTMITNLLQMSHEGKKASYKT